MDELTLERQTKLGKRGKRRLGQLVIAYARQHLKSHPREVGPDNSGPWVRLYMDRRDGPAWPWCAGFSCFILKQAAETLDVAMPIQSSFDVDALASSEGQRPVHRGVESAESKPREAGEPVSQSEARGRLEPRGDRRLAERRHIHQHRGQHERRRQRRGLRGLLPHPDWASKDVIRI
jgi:hypothetical protein